jgi:hypothetical protein
MKFPEYEVKGIQPLVAHSPLDLWFLTVRAFSSALGVVRSTILIGLRTLVSEGVSAWPRWCCAYVSNHTLLLAFDARVGAKPRWVCRALCSTGKVPVERRCIARGGKMVIW